MYSVLGTHQTESSKTTPTNLDKYLLDFVSWEGGDWDLSCVPSIEFTFRPYSILSIFMGMKLVRPIMCYGEVVLHCTEERTGLSVIEQKYVQTNR